MFPTADQTPKAVELISKAVSGIILLPNKPSVDAIAAATALYMGLMKINKNVSIVCSQPVQSDLTGADKVQNTLSVSGDNLVVSFPYADGSIDKIDYNIQGTQFNLVITPRQGFPKLNPQEVKYSYTGGTFDFVITIDSPSLTALGEIYTNNQAVFQGKQIINIDRHLTNAFYGTVNLVNKASASVSETVLKLLEGLSSDIDKDIATNLYAGIAAATNNFTAYTVNADTFETIAKLLKKGAIKKMQQAGAQQQQSFAPRAYPAQQQSYQMAPAPFIPNPVSSPMPMPSQPMMQQPQMVNQQQAPMPQGFSVKQPGIERQQIQSIASVESQESPSAQEGADDDQDWLKPSMFKGSGLM